MFPQFLRRTLISLSLKHEKPSNLTIISSSFTTLATPTAKPSSQITNYLTTHHKFSPETALKASTFLAKFKYYKKKSLLVLNFFKKIGFSNTQLENLVLCDPRVFAADPERHFRPKIRGIQELGFSDDELISLLSNVPGILTLHRSIEAIVSSISVLQTVMGSNLDVIKLLKICNWFLSSDLDKNLVPNIELMEECGIRKEQIKRNLFSFPRCFLLKTEFMRECMRKVDEMGLSKSSKLYIHGVRVVSSMTMENWESKLKLFRSLGFDEDDIVKVFRRTPQVFALSERKILEVSKLLLTVEGVTMSYLIRHAELLVYSPKSRIGPRLEILNALLSKSLLPKEPTMTFVCKMTDNAFIQKYVVPYESEIGEVGARYIARIASGAS